MNHLTTESALKAKQLVQDNGHDEALLIVANQIGSIKDSISMFGMNDKLAASLGYWDEVKKAIEFERSTIRHRHHIDIENDLNGEVN